MKKMLVVSDSLRTGGIQSSLKSFLKNMSKEDYKITLFLFNDSNREYLNNSNVDIITGTKLLKLISYTADEAKQKGVLIYITRKILALLCKIFTSSFVYSFIFLFEKKLYDYDIAISYSNNISNHSVYFGYNKFVLEKVVSNSKIGCIHADYNILHSKFSDKEYKKFNDIWCVSSFVRETFLKYNSNLNDRCHVVYNFIDEDRLKKIGINPYNEPKFHIVTIGRLDQNKSQIDAIEIALKLKEKKLSFDWYLIGEGPERYKIEREIENNMLDEYIYLLGNRDNVSDYLINSNVFVSLSRTESYGLAIAEALFLNSVVVVRNIPAVSELISDNGIICNNINEFTNELYQLATNDLYFKKWKEKAKLYYNNKTNIETINSLLKGEV